MPNSWDIRARGGGISSTSRWDTVRSRRGLLWSEGDSWASDMVLCGCRIYLDTGAASHAPDDTWYSSTWDHADTPARQSTLHHTSDWGGVGDISLHYLQGMIGIFFGIVGTFFIEIQNTITKYQSTKYHPLTIAWVGSVCVCLFYVWWLIIWSDVYGYSHFIPKKESLWLLSLRIILECIQAYITILAIRDTERSTYGFIRILTLPVLLVFDIFIGYSITMIQSICIIFMTWLLTYTLAFDQWKTYRWWWYALFSAINAACTLSLYKYSLSHYGNTVIGDQLIITTIVCLFFSIWIYIVRPNKIRWLFYDTYFLWQGIAMAIGSVLMSFGYQYLLAVEVTMLTRVWWVFWSLVFGVIIFHEKHVYRKAIYVVILCILMSVVLFYGK